MLRYGFSKWLYVKGTFVSWPTLGANVVSSFILGALLYVTFVRNPGMDPAWRLFLGVGLCGGFSTFSTFSYETFALLENGHIPGALWNVVLNMLLCLGAVWLGLSLAQWTR